MKGQWSNFTVAVIVGVIALAVIFFIVLRTVPAISKGIDNILLGVKKPICCTMLGCKPAAEQITQNPTGGILCSTFCWGVCG